MGCKYEVTNDLVRLLDCSLRDSVCRERCTKSTNGHFCEEFGGQKKLHENTICMFCEEFA